MDFHIEYGVQAESITKEIKAIAVPPMYAMLSLKKGATASARTTQSLYRTEPVRTRKLI